MSMYHTSKYSGIGQVSSVDVEAITALYVDSVAAYVDHHTRRAGVESATRTDTAQAADVGAGDRGTIDVEAGRGWESPVELAVQFPAQAKPRQPHPSDIAQVWVDCELGRVAICRHELPEYRLWLYGHKFANGEGRILKSEMYKSIARLGIATSRSTFAGIIARGNRLYWRERGGYLYLTGWRKLSQKLTRWEAKYAPDHVATNRPGQRRVQLDLTGSLKLAHALIYNGWIAVKSEKLGYLEIARSTLSALWNRSKKQLITWEQLVGIRAELRYAEHHDITAPLVPNYAYLCIDTDGKEFASWRLPNRFTPASANISTTNGQRKRVRSACNHVVESVDPAIQTPGGKRRLLRTGRTNFSDRMGKNGLIPAHKQLDKHLRKHNDIFDRRHYAYIATRYGKHIYELSDGVQVRNGAGRDWIAEKSPAFIARRSGYRLWWLDRGDKELS
jgi:hypothetical protein